MGFPGGSDSKESTCNVGDLGSIPGLGRSPGGGHGNPLQYSCLENSMDRVAWWATVHGVTKSPTRLKRLSIAQHNEPGAHSARDTGKFFINKKGKRTGSLLGRQNKDQRLGVAPRGQGFCYPLHIFHAEPGPYQPVWRQRLGCICVAQPCTLSAWHPAQHP